MRRPAHGTLRVRSVEVVLEGLRPVLIADVRVEVIGAIEGAAYEVGPVLEVVEEDGEAAGAAWRCFGEGCATRVDTASELYPLELRWALDQAAEEPSVVRPPRMRVELRERDAAGRARVVEATRTYDLHEACARLARVPLDLRRIARESAGAGGELTVRTVRAVGGCEGPVLHAEIDHVVEAVGGGGHPVLRIGFGFPGGREIVCAGPDCVAALEPPERGTTVVQKPLGPSLAALGRPATRAEIHLLLERPPHDGPLDRHVYELASPGAGIAMPRRP